MATVTWLGGTSTDIGVVANWSGGAFPAVGDTALWNAPTTYAPASGTAANAITNLVITDGVGTQAMGTASGTCTWLGITGYAQLANRAGSQWMASSGTVASLRVETPAGSTVYLTNGTYTSAVGNANKIDVGASAVLVTGLSNGAEWIVATNGTAITNLRGTFKITLTSRNITNCYADPGSIVTLKGSAIVATLGYFVGAILNHQSSGTLAGIELRNRSLLTVDGNPNATAQGGTVSIFGGSRVVDVASGCTLTYTASYVGPNYASNPGSP